MKKLLIIGLLLCLMSGCQKNTGTFAQGDKNLSSVLRISTNRLRTEPFQFHC